MKVEKSVPSRLEADAGVYRRVPLVCSETVACAELLTDPSASGFGAAAGDSKA